MTEKQVQLVKRSWILISRIDPVLVGDVFYTRLFFTNPELKILFTTDRSEQSQKLVDMLTAIITSIDRMPELQHDIRQLALRHQQYNVLPRHYGPVGSALLWTLEHALGADFTPALRDAWQACYQRLSAAMLGAPIH
jgi:hemoglobin-like flavoprotein